MKKIILTAAILFSVFHSFSQTKDELEIFNQGRNRITKNAMIVLGGWSIANLVYSGIATGRTSGSDKYFHQMNVMWGGINFGLAALGYLGTRNKNSLSLTQSLKQQAGIEKTYMFNLGLDVAYVASGFYLKERGKNNTKNAEKFKGYGESIILQGAALMVLDAVLFTVHNRHSKKLYKVVDKIQIAATGDGIGLLVGL
ncbi:MAG: hypothetical protein ABIO04_04860 [Ferruginibacter sp.]